MMKNAVAVKFRCTLTSPFHTTQRRYQNLLKCAPYILGTTFRGSILGFLIKKHCTNTKINQLKRVNDKDQIDEFHRDCEQKCLVKELFRREGDIQFSFGTFEHERYLQTTRIALTREHKTAAKGAIINVECVREGSEFIFEVILAEDLVENKEEIKEAVEFAGEYAGIGSFKSVGFGKYEVKDVTEEDLESFLEINEFEDLGNIVEIKFDTPLVFRMDSLDEVLIAEMISEYLQKRYCEIMQQSKAEKISLRDLSFRVKPEFVHRYSLELSQKVNRLVLDKGSRIRFDIGGTDDEVSAQFGVGSRFGIGEWSNYGFGRFCKVGEENGGND